MIQLVKPMSMLPYTIGHMLAVYFGIYLYQAAPVLYAVIVIAALLIGQQKYKRLQVGK